jgi:hypothetical protein
MGEPSDGIDLNQTLIEVQFSGLPDRYRARQPPPPDDPPPPEASVVWIHFTSMILFGR